MIYFICYRKKVQEDQKLREKNSLNHLSFNKALNHSPALSNHDIYILLEYISRR